MASGHGGQLEAPYGELVVSGHGLMAVRADGGRTFCAAAPRSQGSCGSAVKWAWMSGALQQRAAKDIGQTGESGGELIWELELSKIEVSTLPDGEIQVAAVRRPSTGTLSG